MFRDNTIQYKAGAKCFQIVSVVILDLLLCLKIFHILSKGMNKRGKLFIFFAVDGLFAVCDVPQLPW